MPLASVLIGADLADRKSGRKASAETRGDQPVADLHVGADRNVRQFEAVDRAAAVGDRAQAGALDDDRNRVGRVGDQHHDRAVRQHLDDLAHDAVRIDHRLADRDALLRADVEHDALAERIEVDVDEARELHRRGRGSCCASSRSCRRAFCRDQRVEPVQARLREQQLLAQARFSLAS